MSESSEEYLHRAIDTLSQSDPLIKLLQEVNLGRMQPTDAGLRAVTEAWLSTYQQVLEKGEALSLQDLPRLDPSPRLDMLIEAGVFPQSHSGVTGLRAAFQQALADRNASG